MPPMPTLDDLWDYDDPAASEARFRARLTELDAAGDADGAAEARTQLARSLGLQGQYNDGHAELDRVDAEHPTDDRIRVRSLLERGRLRRSSGDPSASVEPFERPGHWHARLVRTAWPSTPPICWLSSTPRPASRPGMSARSTSPTRHPSRRPSDGGAAFGTTSAGHVSSPGTSTAS
jgi:hypothetical protein